MIPEKESAPTVFVVYIQQPVPQEGLVRLEVFRVREDAVAFLRAEYERFLRRVPDAPVREWTETPCVTFVAAGVVRTDYTSWAGRVVERSPDWHEV